MRDILYVDLRHMNNAYNRSGDLKDLAIACTLHLGMAERYTYEDETNLKNSLINISNADYTPQDNDKLYFLPGTSVPRIKLKDLASNQGIKTTRKIETANAIFASRGTLNKLTDYQWEYPFETALFKQWVEDARDFFDEERDFEKLETALEFYTEHEVLVTWQSWRILTDSDTSFYISQGKDPKGIKYNSSERYLRITEGREEVCKALLAGGLATIYDEAAILKHVNGDNAVTIDEQVYNNLNMMLDSSDTDNHILAMEIMANSNYNDSMLYLQLLFMNHGHTMDARREKNHVNFKSLLSYLDKSPSNMISSLDDVMKGLRDNGRMTPENVEKLLTLEAERVLNITGSYQFFKIKSVTLDKQYLQEMNYNLDFKMQDDFEPIVVEEPEPEVVEEPEIENEEPQAEEAVVTEEPVEMDNTDGFDVG